MDGELQKTIKEESKTNKKLSLTKEKNALQNKELNAKAIAEFKILRKI